MKRFYRLLFCNFICLFIFSSLLLTLPNKSQAQQCLLSAPKNFFAKNITSCSATVSWKTLAGAKKYKVKYQVTGANGWTSYSTTDTFYVFTGLGDGVKYTFSVQGVCQTGGGGAISKIKIKTADCTLPSSIQKTNISSSEENISVITTCPFDVLYCYFGTQINALTNLISSTNNEITLSNLQQGTTYYFKVSTCPLSKNNFTAVDSFKTIASKPNIILIVLDDARYDQYSCNGAPPFMYTPNIDRIANEGINFKNSFVVHSECAPGRATIATGDYTSRHGVYDNIHPYSLNPNLPLLPSILHSNGYYTALVGKNHDIYSYTGGYFDYWLEYIGSAGWNKNTFNYQGNDEVIQGYDTNVITDTMLSVMDKVTEPYFIQLAYHAPHDPLVPAQQYDHTFDGVQIAFGPDTAKYSVNYPSFLYTLSVGATASAKEANKNWRETLEMLLSVDDGVGEILDKLESNGQLDHTLVVFTSDNGHLIGEHYLNAKRFAYEQSLRVPLFIRYPQWFSAGSIDTSNLALNIDYAPTLIQAAGIPDTFNMDGKSLESFHSGADSRTSMYYHYWYSEEGTWHLLPPIHAVRDKHYVLIDYGCSADTTEEFFDLENDPTEITNQINNSAFSPLIASYRSLLSQMKLQYADTTADTELNCYLANPVYQKQQAVAVNTNFVVYPNPSNGFFTIENLSSDELQLVLMNELGQEINSFSILPESNEQLCTPKSGIYLLRCKTGSGFITQKIVSE